MAQTIGQHGVAAFTSPVNGDLLNATVVLSNDNTTRSAYVDHDIDSGIHVQSSLLAARPAAGTAGRKWMTTDASSVKLWFDTGAAWEEIAYLPSAGGTVAGNVSITGTLGVTGLITATGGVSGNVTGAVTGNASTATTLQTSRNINGVAFDGSADITITAVAAAGSLTGATLASNVLASSLTSVGTLAALTVTAPITGSVTGASGSTTGNAATATALQTARAINGTNFDGTAAITVTAAAGTLTGATLASGVTASSLTSVGSLTALTVAGTTTIQQVLEKATVSATAATGVINYDALTQAVLFYTSNASANWTPNFRGSSGTTLASMMAVGQSITLTFMVTQGTTAYYASAHQIDGSSVTPKWQGGTAPTAGNASSIDIYTYVIIKTAATPTYTVLASQTRFA